MATPTELAETYCVAEDILPAHIETGTKWPLFAEDSFKCSICKESSSNWNQRSLPVVEGPLKKKKKSALALLIIFRLRQTIYPKAMTLIPVLYVFGKDLIIILLLKWYILLKY